jgi:sigma-54-dependent transcriptional regulator
MYRPLEDPQGVITALAFLLEAEALENLPPELSERLLDAFDLTGLEIRDAGDEHSIWRVGSGSAGAEVRHGSYLMIPLGGDAPNGPAWNLFLGTLDRFSSPSSAQEDPEVGDTGFHGISAGARSVRLELRELGSSHLPVLLVGETGVGKEVAARGLHRISGRSGPFVAVNVAAIPANLLEAELFGSVKGAFTGADRSRRGLAVTADRGTLFLDEIGELDPLLQVKLLRFLDSQEIRPVGADQSRVVDVRILSATHRDLQQKISEGTFRPDLFFRMASLPIVIPPLRERREDIPILKELFEGDAVARHGLRPARWSPEAEAALYRYLWPGNVRELRQTVEVALVRAAGGIVRVDHLPIASAGDDLPTGTWDEALKKFRRRFLVAALRRNDGNRSATARELGISRQALLYHIRALGLQNLESN